MLRPNLYWLLVFVPVSLAVDLTRGSSLLLFITCAIAIVPLAGLVGRSTGSIAAHSGPRVGGLLNATFGNLTEMIIGVLLVAAGEVEVVKASLIGSIIGNLVLVLGASLFIGGLRHKELRFSARSAGLQTASLLLAVLALVMPAIFVSTDRTTGAEREVVSVVVAGVLILLYIATLIYTQVTHAHLFRAAEAEGPSEWGRRTALLILLAAAVVVGVESELLVTSLEPTVAAIGFTKVFVGIFVVAVIGNAAEHVSAVGFAWHNQADVTMEIVFGSSAQIAMFVAPLLIFVSLALSRPMDFVFTPFEIAAVGLSTIIVGLISLDGRSNWLEGLQLLGAYVIMAISFFFVGSPLSR
ncbi:MAG: calcium/proton exchanger [Candidatus Dormibacteraeota bacterium]|nr:calcium/proton exchanger [Candidatus Dormibacteraeota bacterium]